MKKLIREDFPLLMNHKSLVYFDNAATTQKPQQVIDSLYKFYMYDYGAVSRGIYALGERATELYNDARVKVARFIGAHFDEIVFTKGTTESINFIASTWAEDHLCEGDEIVLTQMEHHSNLIPWQEVAKRKKVVLKFIPIIKPGILDVSQLSNIITSRTKLVSVIHESNALGTLNPIEAIIEAAHKVGARVLIDAAQSAPCRRINFSALGADFLAFSGHKMLGPSGIGVLVIKRSVQHEVRPYQFGGGMVLQATLTDASYLESPGRYEAGTPPIAQAIGLGYAIDYLESLPFEHVGPYLSSLCEYAIEGLLKNSCVTIHGPIEQLKAEGHLVSFTLPVLHAHDLAAYLDKHNIAVRSGNYCAQPLARILNISAMARMSFYMYNTKDEIDYALDVLKKLCKK
jgi:cysteine desulfurase/selenocysteine lyase